MDTGSHTAFLFPLVIDALPGYVDVNWRKAEKDYGNLLDLDGDGKITMADARIAWDHAKEVLTFNLPAGAGFTGGLLMGVGVGAGKAGAAALVYGIGARGALMAGGAATSAPAVLVALRTQLGLEHQGEAADDGSSGELVTDAAAAANTNTGSSQPAAVQNPYFVGDIPRAPEALDAYLSVRSLGELRQTETQLQLATDSPQSDKELQAALAKIEARKKQEKKKTSSGWF